MKLGDHIARAARAVDEAAQHHDAAMRAQSRGDKKNADASHVKLGRCLRSAQLAFRDLAAAAMEQDSTNSKTVQTSNGTGVSGGSDNGRGSPLLSGDIGGWLERARIGGRQ